MVPPRAPAPVRRPAAPCQHPLCPIIAELREMASRLADFDGGAARRRTAPGADSRARNIDTEADVPLVPHRTLGCELQDLLHVGEVEILDQLLRGHHHRLRNFARRQVNLGGSTSCLAHRVGDGAALLRRELALNGVTDRSCDGSNAGAVRAPALVARGLACATLFFTASGLTTTGASSVASASGVTCSPDAGAAVSGSGADSSVW